MDQEAEFLVLNFSQPFDNYMIKVLTTTLITLISIGAPNFIDYFCRYSQVKIPENCVRFSCYFQFIF